MYSNKSKSKERRILFANIKPKQDRKSKIKQRKHSLGSKKIKKTMTQSFRDSSLLLILSFCSSVLNPEPATTQSTTTSFFASSGISVGVVTGGRTPGETILVTVIAEVLSVEL